MSKNYTGSFAVERFTGKQNQNGPVVYESTDKQEEGIIGIK